MGSRCTLNSIGSLDDRPPKSAHLHSSKIIAYLALSDSVEESSFSTCLNWWLLNVFDFWS